MLWFLRPETLSIDNENRSFAIKSCNQIKFYLAKKHEIKENLDSVIFSKFQSKIH